MSNAYRTAAEESGLNWSTQFRKFYAGKKMDVEGFSKILEKQDGWAPEELLAKLVDSDLKELFAASDRLQKLSQKNAFYSYYKKIIDKAILLVLERSPESFDGLSESQKEAVFGAKIEMPDEDEFYNTVYAVLENPAELASAGTFYTGQSFEDILDRLVGEEKVLSPKIADILKSMDANYTLHYMERSSQK